MPLLRRRERPAIPQVGKRMRHTTASIFPSRSSSVLRTEEVLVLRWMRRKKKAGWLASKAAGVHFSCSWESGGCKGGDSVRFVRDAPLLDVVWQPAVRSRASVVAVRRIRRHPLPLDNALADGRARAEQGCGGDEEGERKEWARYRYFVPALHGPISRNDAKTVAGSTRR